MKTLFLDLSMGAAGDMLCAALYELIDNKEEFINEINAAGIPGAAIEAQPAVKCGICGTHMKVTVGGKEEASEDFHGNSHSEDGHDGSEAGHNHLGGHHDPSHAEYAHEHTHGNHEECSHTHEHEHVGYGADCESIHTGHEHSHDEHEHNHHHAHRSMADVEAIIDSLNVSDKVKTDAKAVYKIIARAESRAHAVEVSEIHFHEVGTMDAIADITSVCLLMEKLAPDNVIASPVCTGFGHVYASHGVIPVPAPATAYILEEIPSYEGNIEAELCTPTGAALVSYFAGEFSRMPVLMDKKTGYGMGMKDFKKCNALRAVIGFDDFESAKAEKPENENNLCYTSGRPNPPEKPNDADHSEAKCGQKQQGALPDGSFNFKADDASEDESAGAGLKDNVIEFSLTVDDMTGEEIGFACEQIFEAGALDVFTQPVYMKKNRPGTVIDVLCKTEDEEKIIAAIFKYTTTLGIRQAICERYILKREFDTVKTQYGPVKIKKSEGYGTARFKAEYDDLAKTAKENGLCLDEVKEAVRKNLQEPAPPVSESLKTL